MTEGKTTDCVMEGIRLWKEVYTGKAVNVAMIQDDVLAVCKERDALLLLAREQDECIKGNMRALAAGCRFREGLEGARKALESNQPHAALALIETALLYKPWPSMTTCPHDPQATTGPIGMYHCPECGEMVIAGCPHPDYSIPLEEP